MNPFSYGTIVRGDYFYDRKDETQRVVSTLLGGNNLVLFAPRRYGKTSLVFRAMEQIEQEEDVMYIYFDLLPVYSLESFVSYYIQAIEKGQNSIDKLIRILADAVKNIRPKLTFGNNGEPEFGIDFIEHKVSMDTVSDVLDLPEKIARKGKRVIVILDEFQEIVKLEKYGLENLLRSKVQQQQQVNYLFLGSKTHLLNDMFTNEKRPFYNAAFHLQLSTLPRTETILFLQTRFAESKIELTEQDALYLIDQTADIPYYIQLLAAEIWQYMINSETRVTPEIIDCCVSRIVELKHDYYFELYDKHSTMQKNLLKALIVSGENIFSSGYIKRYRLSAVSTVQKSVITLMDNGIIDKIENRYFISDPFFKRFIQNYA